MRFNDFWFWLHNSSAHITHLLTYSLNLQTCHCAFGEIGSGPVFCSHMNDRRSVTSTRIRARQNHYWRAGLSNEHLSRALRSASSTLIRRPPTRTLECGWWSAALFGRCHSGGVVLWAGNWIKNGAKFGPDVALWCPELKRENYSTIRYEYSVLYTSIVSIQHCMMIDLLMSLL